jgi:hypothetical protein
MNNKTIVIVSVSVIVLFIIIYFAYQYGKDKTNPSHTKVGSDVYGTPLSEEEQNTIVALADSLYIDMDGINMLGHEDDLYNQLSKLSDSHLVALSNVFNHKYQDESGESFITWLRNESFDWDSFTNQDITNVVIQRLAALGVS